MLKISDEFDSGSVDILLYKIDTIQLLNHYLAFKFVELANQNSGFIIKLENVIAYRDKMKNKTPACFRIGSGGSTYAFDVSARLQKKEIMDYMILYIFANEAHSDVVFRGLAKNITVTVFDDFSKVDWPFA